MAKATLTDIKTKTKITSIKDFKSSKIKTVNYSKTTLTDVKTKTKIIPIKGFKSSGIKTVDYSKKVSINAILPFRLKITNIGIEGIDPLNPPGIGMQIIGFSNYIL